MNSLFSAFLLRPSSLHFNYRPPLNAISSPHLPNLRLSLSTKRRVSNIINQMQRTLRPFQTSEIENAVSGRSLTQSKICIQSSHPDQTVRHKLPTSYSLPIQNTSIFDNILSTIVAHSISYYRFPTRNHSAIFHINGIINLLKMVSFFHQPQLSISFPSPNFSRFFLQYY